MHENTFVTVSVDGYDFHQLFRNYCFVLIEELSLKYELKLVSSNLFCRIKYSNTVVGS